MKMMQKIMTVLAVCVLLSLSVLPVFAAGGEVTYQGQAEKFFFAPGSEYSPTDLFPNFKDVMPGDTLEQAITLKNDASNKVKVKVYMRSLGAQEGSEEFLSKLGLRVEKLQDTELFDAPADQRDGLADWTYLGTLYSGGEIDLNVVLEVPTSLDNTFKKYVGYLDWEFMVEEYPIESTDPKPPQTGDTTDFRPWLILLLCSALAIVIYIVVYCVRRSKKGKGEGES